MKTLPRLWLRFVALLGLALTLGMACNLSGDDAARPADTQATVQALVEATLTAAAAPPAGTTEAPPASGGPSTTPTVTPTATPAANPAAAVPAFVWAYREDLNALVLYDAQGQIMVTVPVEHPAFAVKPATSAHTLHYLTPGGPYDQVMVALAAQHQDNKAWITTLDVASPGGWRSEFQAPQRIVGVTGIPGAPRVAYSVLSISGYQHHSALYAHQIGQAPPTQSLWEMTSNDARFLVPVGMDTHGVWFTHGVEGAPIPPRGLYFVDFQGQFVSVLTQRLVGVDVPLGWVAYQTDNREVAWQRLQSGPGASLVGAPVVVAEPIFSVDQGVLYPGAAFSSQYIAWEAFIGSPLDGASYIRIYTLDGQPVTLQDDQGPDPAAGVFEAAPVAWLQAGPNGDERVVITGFAQNTRAAVLVIAPPDLTSAVVVPGAFMGVAYLQP